MIASGLRYAAIGAALAVLTGCNEKPAFDPAKISSNLAVFTDTSKSLAERRLIEVPVGELPLPDGRLVAFDPLVQPDAAAFSRTVEPGTYPVSFIRGAADYSRPALLVIRFSDAKIERFELATIEGQDLGTLKDDEFFGIGVDAGIAGFANATYGAAQARFEKAEQEKPGSEYSNYYDDVIANAMPGKGGDEFALDRPFKDEDAAAAMTQAGWGDGFYPTFWGLDKDGKPALAFVEFFVMKDGDGRSDFEKEEAVVLAKMTPQQQADNKAAYKALQDGDEASFASYVAEGKIEPKGYVLGEGNSFMVQAIRLDRPVALRRMMEAGADNSPGPNDNMSGETYSAFARSFVEAAKEPAIGKTPKLAPRSPELMAVIAELEKRPGGSDQSK